MNLLRDTSRWSIGWRMTLAVMAGSLHAVSMSWPTSGQPVWWLQLLALSVLAGMLRSSPGWRVAALLGWLFGTAWLVGTVSWLFTAMHTYGGLPSMLAALAVFALSALLALYYAAAAGLFVALSARNDAAAALVFAALWLVAELARGTWLTGFGWGASGYAQIDGPLAGLAPWVGAYGLAAVTAWLAMSLAKLVELRSEPSRGWRLGTLTLILLIVAVPVTYRRFAAERSHSSGELSVTLLQGNIPQNEKFEAGSGVPLALQWYAEQLQSSASSLVIAPETAIPVLPQQLPPGYWEALQQRFDKTGQAALIGTPLGNEQLGYTNSVIGLKPAQAQTWRYDKSHLVPFGEFIPPLFKWFTAMMHIPLGDFNRGALRQAPFEWQGQRLSGNICYENLFGEELAAQFIDPAQAPTIFVNISNLGWFGAGQAIDQHLQISRLRALEFERPFLLATNTGATAIIDHRGRVTHALARGTRSALVGSVQGRSGVTPYAWWAARFGLWPLWLLSLGVVLLAVRKVVQKA